MAGLSRRLWTLTAATVGSLLFAAALAGSPANAAPNQNNECNGAFQGTPAGTLALTSTPVAGDTNGATSISITATWSPADWSGTTLDKILNCVQVNGALVDALSQIDKPTANDGTQPFTIDLTGLKAGDEVCSRARLSGQPAGSNVSTQKSNVLCWRVTDGNNPPPPAPTYKITVTKNVVNGAGGESFTFTVDCDPVVLDASNVAGATFDAGKASFSLGDDGTKEITGLPSGASCLIAETVPGSPTWTTTINGAASASRSTEVAVTVSGTAADRTAAFENTRVTPNVTPTPDQTPTQTGAVVEGVQVTRDVAPAAAPAAQAAPAVAVKGVTVAATGMSPTLFYLGTALVALGTLLLVGSRRLRPVGVHAGS